VPLLVRAKTQAPFVLLSATIKPGEEEMLSKAFYSELEVVRACTTRSNVGMSVKTVSTHKARLLAKLGLPSLAALIRYTLDNRG
jgi:FixJ family two-component response regulator